MAGNRGWYLYTDNVNRRYAINLDRSNADAIGNIPLSTVPDGASLPIMTWNQRCRTIVCRHRVLGIQRELVAGDPLIWLNHPLDSFVDLPVYRDTDSQLEPFQVVKHKSERMPRTGFTL